MIYGIILFWKDNENCLPFLWSKLGESNKKQVAFKMIFSAGNDLCVYYFLWSLWGIVIGRKKIVIIMRFISSQFKQWEQIILAKFQERTN